MKTNINFIKFKNFSFILSGVLIIISLWSMFGPKGLNLGPLSPKGFNFGIDFQGGGVVQIMIYNGSTQESVRTIANDAQMGNEIQNVVVDSSNSLSNAKSYVIKTPITDADKKYIAQRRDASGDMTENLFFKEKVAGFVAQLNNKFGSEYVLTGDELTNAIALYGADDIPGEIVEKRTESSRTVDNVVTSSINIVSASQSATLRWQSIFLALFVVAIMLGYLSLRFKFKYGVGAVLSLVHDTIIILGFCSVAQLDFDMTLVAALLTFMGYTVNDTIVIYDRIREDMIILKEQKLTFIFNKAINQCITRSLLTSFTTLLAVVALFVFAGEKLRGFSSAMIFGIIIGTYSSLFVASPIVYVLEKWFNKDHKNENKVEKKTEDKDVNVDDDAQKNSNVETSNYTNNVVLSKKQQKKLESIKNQADSDK